MGTRGQQRWSRHGCREGVGRFFQPPWPGHGSTTRHPATKKEAASSLAKIGGFMFGDVSGADGDCSRKKSDLAGRGCAHQTGAKEEGT